MATLASAVTATRVAKTATPVAKAEPHAQGQPAPSRILAAPGCQIARPALPGKPASIPPHDASVETPGFAAVTSSPLLLPLQRKLAIGSSADPLETEADAAAQAIMRSPGPAARARVASTPQVEAPPSVHQVLRFPGQRLDDETRDWAETAFQRDFRQVRLHSGPQAEASAVDIQARAYTVGSHVVLGPGGLPGSGGYRRLLAHELAHVVQQGMAPPRPTAAEGPAVAAIPHRAAAPLVQRQDADDTRDRDLGFVTEHLPCSSRER